MNTIHLVIGMMIGLGSYCFIAWLYYALKYRRWYKKEMERHNKQMAELDEKYAKMLEERCLKQNTHT